MWLGQVTTIDCAFITEDGNVLGASFNPKFTVSGSTDNEEQVVEDFSSIKKKLKSQIDDKETGFDHKLIISNRSGVVSTKLVGHIYVIRTKMFEIRVPDNGVRFIEEDLEKNSFDTFTIALEEYLNKLNPTLKIKCFNTIDIEGMPGQHNGNVFYFSYTHGLKNSSSFGCQTLHGHLSYLAVAIDSISNDELVEFGKTTQKVVDKFDNTMFIWSSNWDELSKTVTYDSKCRGTIQIKIISDDAKYQIVDTETTVENLTDFFVEQIKAECLTDGLDVDKISSIYVSEGLAKGALFEKRNG
jgi:6-pyruvoyl-tetrahydropterin synthase